LTKAQALTATDGKNAHIAGAIYLPSRPNHYDGHKKAAPELPVTA